MLTTLSHVTWIAVADYWRDDLHIAIRAPEHNSTSRILLHTCSNAVFGLYFIYC